MSESAAVPQFAVERAVNAEALLELRQELRDSERDGSVTDMFICASAHTLSDHPNVNASFHDDVIIRHDVINVGFALALPDLLVVPCVHDAHLLSLGNIARERERLQAAARDGALTPPDVLDTTFTISNLAPFGIERFHALVNVPQAAILAIGAIRFGVVDDDGAPRFGRTLQLALTCDHRAVDGAPAALFLKDLAERLETPEWMVSR